METKFTLLTTLEIPFPFWMIQNNLDLMLSFVMCRFIFSGLTSNHLVVSWESADHVYIARIKKSDKSYCSSPVDYLAADSGKHNLLNSGISLCKKLGLSLIDQGDKWCYFSIACQLCVHSWDNSKIREDLLVLFRGSGISVKKDYNYSFGLDTITNLCT